NILTIHEIGEFEGAHFITTEFVDGLTLRARMKAKALPADLALDIAIQITSALAAAHAAGIIHRDIKPENIMVRADGLVKVLDFGVAKFTQVDGNENKDLVETMPGRIIGTAIYMSPEQARGAAIDRRSDIWSLGVVLYEMVAGRPPFWGNTSADVIAAVIEREPLPLATDGSVALESVERIVFKALQKEQEDRYQSAAELLTDLKQLRQTLEHAGERERPDSRELSTDSKGDIPTRNVAVNLKHDTPVSGLPTQSSAQTLAGRIKQHKYAFFAALVILTFGAVAASRFYFAKPIHQPIKSIAVLPFVNASGNDEMEYLSDGMTDSLITSLSQLPQLVVKARSSVFRYKGKEASSQQVGRELNVQAVLNGRVVQRGNDLTLHIELVDVDAETALWSGDYNRPVANLVSLQNEIARDVSQKLQVRLSGADEQKLAKNYAANSEAYQLYLKGRYHLLKTSRPELQTGISYFQQAIAADPSYGLAYVGLADAYRSLAVVGEMPATEGIPKAKEAAQKAIEIDDTLAEAHGELGFIIFWYDWNWSAAENQIKRALELDPGGADIHMYYAHLLSNTGRHEDALAEAKRARELDPLNLRTGALEGLFLFDAGRTDEALDRLRKTSELDPNFWLAHSFAASAYTEKGMFDEAIAEVRKARELDRDSTFLIAFLGYILAKSGKQTEARAELDRLLKLSNERYVAPYNLALIYNGLNERDKTLAWLERGYKERDPKMTFLKVEPKWNNLRSDPRFQDLMRRVGFPK
ncbi:MAG: protein kinase, partial [Acidobacteriota bacterium]